MANSSRVLSVLERAKMVCWFEETNSLAMVARRYRAEFGMDPPQLSSIKRWHQKFMETGSVVRDSPSSNSSSVPSQAVTSDSIAHTNSNNNTLSSAAAALFNANSFAERRL
uniref:DUF4817 domain-containing protein n=1 Tax=Ditylenchus dipsaci TaxID=166011 RepID=A0A915DSZ6_9BILA